MKNKWQKFFRTIGRILAKPSMIALLCILTVLAIGAIFVFRDNTEYMSAVNEDEVRSAYNLLNDSLGDRPITYFDYLSTTDLNWGEGQYTAESVSGIVTLDYNETVNYTIKIRTPGLYYLILDYKAMENALANFNVEIAVNDKRIYEEFKNIELPLYWTDETKDYPLDRYGDQVAPRQIRRDEWTSRYLYNNTYYTADPLLFPLDAGTNVISITNISNDGLGLGGITAQAPNDIPSYEDYHSKYNGSLVTSMVTINSNSYIHKNTTQAIYGAENNPDLMPHDSEYKLINTLSWTEAGSEISYEMEAPEDGFYNIALHYKNPKEEFDVFNTIYIDGKIPFREMTSYAFNSTGNSWNNEILSDEEDRPYEFYLTKGIHTITLRAEMEPIVEAYNYARLISEHVMQFELEITKITGSERDEDRTWQMTRFIPEIPDYLDAYITLINYIKYNLQSYAQGGLNSALMSYLDKAQDFIIEMQEYPDEIALHKQNLTSGRDNSVLKSLSNFTSVLVTQDFSLDRIYVYGNEALPRDKAPWYSTLGNSLMTLAYSFTSEKYDTDNVPEALNIWVNRATTHVDLLQKLADTEFTPMTGVPVKISIMPDANKLTLAQAAKVTPDMALGLQSYMPFELASRGAIYDLTKFDEFWTIANRFVPGSFVPYVYNEGIYAIPETLDFSALIYRKDIYKNLELEPPNTWQEITEQLPTLQRYGMNFYHNISSGVGYKWYYQTSSLILQHNGKLFTDDGLRTAIDQPNGVRGIQALGDLFIAYSLPKEVISFFDSFRYGTLPVGIIGLNDYILIKNGAPELEGQWAISDYPGTVQEDGSISRWYIANGSGGIIFNDSEKINEAWEFLKWWTDYETQVNYTYTLRSTYGKTFVWMPSNIKAVEDAPFDQEDKKVILEQIKWLRDIPRTPGQYMLERSISDIWNKMINDGITAQVAIDEQVIKINREINRKMKELGYFDSEGNLVDSYVIRDVDWIIEQMDKAKGEVE